MWLIREVENMESANKTTRIETHKWLFGAEPPTSIVDTHYEKWVGRAMPLSLLDDLLIQIFCRYFDNSGIQLT